MNGKIHWLHETKRQFCDQMIFLLKILNVELAYWKSLQNAAVKKFIIFLAENLPKPICPQKVFFTKYQHFFMLLRNVGSVS